MLRQQLPVHSPIPLRMLAAGIRGVARPSSVEIEGPTADLARRFSARSVVLTDSGTSALVLALRALVGTGGVVALPAFACIDLTAAAVRAGVRVRLYDVDPYTLGADLDSVRRVLARGVDALVVAHLYGFPVDVTGVRALTDAAGAVLIEDAAQGAGGSLHGAPLGSLGPVSLLSFGRGKGMTAGGGGALLVRQAEIGRRLAPHLDGLGARDRGGRALVATAAQWLLGRPSLYALPASLPMLRLGEMVYHPAGEPRAMDAVTVAMLPHALGAVEAEQRARVANGEWLERSAAAHAVRRARPLAGARPGYLRFPLLDERYSAHADARLGIWRSYPLTLREHAPLKPLLMPGESAEPIAGAAYLARHLLTLPAHSRVGARDRERIAAWLANPEAAHVPTGTRLRTT